jgi:hypothetical protein
MSLYDIFLQRAALEHQNMLNSDNAGLILPAMAQGVAQGIQEQQASVQKQRDEERAFNRDIEKTKIVGRIGLRNDMKLAQYNSYLDRNKFGQSQELIKQKNELDVRMAEIQAELNDKSIIQSSQAQFDKESKLKKEQSDLDIKLAKVKARLDNSGFSPPEGFSISGYNSKGEPSYKKDTGDVGDLNGIQGIQAWAVARKVGGVKGAEKILPSVVKLMSEGKTADEVEDIVRQGSQSTEFTGTFRDAAQAILVSSPANVSDRAMDFIDDKISSGDVEGAKDILKKAARDSAPAANQSIIIEKERAKKFINEIKTELQVLESSGIDTNIFSGSAEQIAKKVGTVKDVRLRKVATKIAAAIQSYRRGMSGAAFSALESKEYKDVFPSIDRTNAFNMASIQALDEVFTGDLDNFYEMQMGSNNYNKLFKSSNKAIQPTGQPTDYQRWHEQSMPEYSPVDKKNRLGEKFPWLYE